VPFEIPESWEWCKVEDFSYVASGSTPDKSAFVDNGIPYLKMYNLKNQAIDFDYKPQYIKEEVHNGKLQRSRTEVGDLIMNIVGPPLGKLAIIPPSLPQSNFNQAAVLIRPILQKDTLVRYLFYYLSQMSEINSIQTRGNAGQKNISLTQCQNIRVPMPPLSEQKRIVAEIERWFTLIDDIESNKQDLLDFIKAAKSKILSLAFSGKLVPQDPNDQPAIDLLHGINPNFKSSDNSHYGKLPSTWCVVKIGDVYDHTTGKALKKSNNDGVLRRYITTSNLYWNSFDLTEVRSMYFTDRELDKCTAKKGDLLVCNGGDVGRAAIWNNDEDICIQNHISRLRPKYDSIVNNLFCCYIFMYLKQKKKLNGKGVAITSLSATDLLSVPIPLPPINEQNRIVQTIQNIENKLNEITAEL
jgi:type I restriction enzyme S subunit